MISKKHNERDEGDHNHPQHDCCDILLNNFQIKKKRYKVLLNYDHIVWERLDVKRCQSTKKAANEEKTSAKAASAVTAAVTQKEAECEREELSHKAPYGHFCNVVHLKEVIRVSKGHTKSDTIRNAHNPLTELTEEPQGGPTEQYLSIYYAERIVASPTDCNRWHIRRLTLHNNDPYIVAKWYDNLQKILTGSTSLRIKRLLVFINPYGGRKMGLQIYERSCKSAIQLAGIDASCIITQRANQIRDILMTHDLTPYDAVCCVGGDGTVAEMINGLILRAMVDQGLDLRRPEHIPKPTLPIGIIPAGSTDTIVYSLHGTSDAQTAAIHLVLGQKRGLDVCSVRNQDGLVRFCTSVMGYGYLGDVAAKSEKYRWMGTKRYEYTGVKSFLLNRGYEAEVQMLLNDDELDGHGRTPSADMICHVNCEKCKWNSYSMSSDSDTDKPTSSNSTLSASQKSAADENSTNKIDNEHSLASDRNNCDKYYSTKQTEKEPQIKRDDGGNERSTCYRSSTDGNVQHQHMKQDKALQEPNEAQKWRVIRGEFFMITGSNISCACTRSPNGISKYCHLGDGHLDVMLIRKTHLLNNARFAINTMSRNGDIRNLSFIEMYRTKQFIFKAKSTSWPHDYNSVRGSCQPIADSYAEAEINVPHNLFSSWNCDGEVVTDLEITMTSHRQLIDVFMRGPYIYRKPLKNSNANSIFCCCHSNS